MILHLSVQVIPFAGLSRQRLCTARSLALVGRPKTAGDLWRDALLMSGPKSKL